MLTLKLLEWRKSIAQLCSQYREKALHVSLTICTSRRPRQNINVHSRPNLRGLKKPQFIFKFRRPFNGELGDELTGEVKTIGFMAHFQLRLNPCSNQMNRFIRSDGSINQISLQIWLRKPSIRTVFVELRCTYKYSSTYFQPFSQRYITGFSKNKVGKEHLRFNCEGDITLRFPTGFTESVWKQKGQSAYVRLGEFRSQS